MAKRPGITRAEQFNRNHKISCPILLTGRRQLCREAPPAWGYSARMSSPFISPALPTSEHRAPPPLIALSIPAFPHSPPAGAPAATHRPRGTSRRLRPPPRPASGAAPGGWGKAGGSPARSPPRAGEERRAAPSFRQGSPPGAAYLCAEVHSCPPDPPALPAARGGDTRPRMRTRAAPQPGLCPAPRRRPPACGIRRIQEPPGKRGVAALRFLLGSPRTGNRLRATPPCFFSREVPRNLWERSGTSHLTSSQNRLKLCSLQRRLVEAGSIPLEIQFNSLSAFTEEHADVLKELALPLNTR